jgi:outer membrane autotransporter protein
VIFGIDRTFGGGLVGVALGFDSVRTTAPGGDKAVGDLFQAAVYGSAHRGRGFVDWQADYVRTSQAVTRSGGPFGVVAKGKTTLEGGGVQVHAGLDLTLRKWRVEPIVGLSAVRVNSGAATETAGGAIAEAIAAGRNESLQSFVGVRLARTVRLGSGITVQAHGLAGRSHEIEDVDAEARAHLVRLGGPDFTVTSPPTGRDAAKLGAGFSAQVTPNVTVYGAYSAELARDRESQQVALGARVRW